LSERLRNLFRLPPGERAILAEAWGLFLLVELALRVLSFKRLLGLHRKLSRTTGATPASGRPASLARVVWLVEVAGRYAPVNPTCLKKALVLSWLLGRWGIPTALRIGVSREEGKLRAHAWLDYAGEPILGGQEAGRYEPLFHSR